MKGKVTGMGKEKEKETTKGSNKEKGQGTDISKGRKNCEIKQFCKMFLVTYCFCFLYPI